MEVGPSARSVIEYEVPDLVSVNGVVRSVCATARALGFDEKSVEHVSIATTELATNLARHGCQNGRLLVGQISGPTGMGVEIIAKDDGPGIADIEHALKDAYSTRDSMGCGLGAVRRLMDDFDIYSKPTTETPNRSAGEQRSGGTIVMARKWLKPSQNDKSLSCSGHSRPFPGLVENGDCFTVKSSNRWTLIALADGLGHGREAEQASRAAIEHVEENLEKPLDSLLRELHEKLKGTRGTAINLLRIDSTNRTLEFVGVGNIEVRIHPRLQMTPFPKPGVIGAGPLPNISVLTLEWPENGSLLMFSDGLSSRLGFERRPDLLALHPSVLCHCLVHEYGRTNDDATAVVLKG